MAASQNRRLCPRHLRAVAYTLRHHLRLRPIITIGGSRIAAYFVCIKAIRSPIPGAAALRDAPRLPRSNPAKRGAGTYGAVQALGYGLMVSLYYDLRGSIVWPRSRPRHRHRTHSRARKQVAPTARVLDGMVTAPPFTDNWASAFARRRRRSTVPRH